MRIAVIGSGISGITAAYLLSHKYEVTLFEKNDYLGGHTNTRHVLDAIGKSVAVDTGFIVCNPVNYPIFLKFLRRLNVQLQPAEMSFGFLNRASNFSYIGPTVTEFLRMPGNLLSPRFLSFVLEQRRFNREVLNDISLGILKNQPLVDYLRQKKVSRFFTENYIVPLIASIWSSPEMDVEHFPANTFAVFFRNHSMLDFRGRPQWYSVVHGSVSYIKAFKEQFRGEIYNGASVTQVVREAERSVVVTRENSFAFDKIVIATHANEALSLLSTPTVEEEDLLGSWRYSKNRAVLHTDASVLPMPRRHWASWNYIHGEAGSTQGVSITYYMNKLQRLDTETDFFVTLNPCREIDRSKVCYEILYEHPVYTPASVVTQAGIRRIQGDNNTYYCGAHLGYGFHEDGARSGLEVARHFGIEL